MKTSGPWGLLERAHLMENEYPPTWHLIVGSLVVWLLGSQASDYGPYTASIGAVALLSIAWVFLPWALSAAIAGFKWFIRTAIKRKTSFKKDLNFSVETSLILVALVALLRWVSGDF